MLLTDATSKKPLGHCARNFVSISTCKTRSGAQRLKANMSKELVSRNFHPHGRKKMERQKIAKNLGRTAFALRLPDCSRHPNFVEARDARRCGWIMRKNKVLNPRRLIYARTFPQLKAWRDPLVRTNLWVRAPTAASRLHCRRSQPKKGALCGGRGLPGPSRAAALFSLFVRDGEG